MSTKLKPKKFDIGLNKAVKILRFYDKHMVMPNYPINLPESEYDFSRKLVFTYMSLIEDGQIYKKCTKCEDIVPVAEFGSTVEGKPMTACKKCISDYYREYTKENADRIMNNRILRDYTQKTKR